MTGMGSWCSATTVSPTWRIHDSWCMCTSPTSERSAPEQKLPSAPVTTTTRSRSGSAEMARNTSRSSPNILGLAAFLRNGRFIVTVTMPPARSTCSVSMAANILTPMGFDPYRQQKRRTSDYVMVVAAVAVCVALLLWALLG